MTFIELDSTMQVSGLVGGGQRFNLNDGGAGFGGVLFVNNAPSFFGDVEFGNAGGFLDFSKVWQQARLTRFW